MGNRTIEFSYDEWYHCYTRGIDKRRVFLTNSDKERYVSLLYLCNAPEPIHRSDLSGDYDKIFSYPRAETLVSIGAYCLMPNHVHLLIKEKTEGGISKFMQKLGTAYTMYFNILNERSGSLFVKPFRAKHVASDDYLQRVISYIHLNPSELAEPEWKRGKAHEKRLRAFLRRYEYSSLLDHEQVRRPQNSVLGGEIFDVSTQRDISMIIKDARAYYLELTGSEFVDTVKASP